MTVTLFCGALPGRPRSSAALILSRVPLDRNGPTPVPTLQALVLQGKSAADRSRATPATHEILRPVEQPPQNDARSSGVRHSREGRRSDCTRFFGHPPWPGRRYVNLVGRLPPSMGPKSVTAPSDAWIPINRFNPQSHWNCSLFATGRRMGRFGFEIWSMEVLQRSHPSGGDPLQVHHGRSLKNNGFRNEHIETA